MTDTSAQADTGDDTPTVEDFKPITSQEDLNKVIGERVARERGKFADYKDLKAKAARLDEIEAANKTEAEKAAERITALERQLASEQSAAMRARIQAKHGISDEDAALFLTGADEDTLTKQAERLAQRAEDRLKNGNRAPLQGRTPTTDSSDGEARAFARNLFGSGD